MMISKSHLFRFALYAFGVLALSFLLSPSPCMASPTPLGASTSSSLGAYSYSYEIPGALVLSGFVAGSGYSIGFVGAVFCGSGGSWYWCSGGSTSYSLAVPGVFEGELYETGAAVTVTQASVSGPIALTYVVDGYTVVFDLYEDPVLLSSLVDESPEVEGVSYVDLTVTGGCYTTATSCSATSTSSPTPEPASLLLLGSGLAGLGLIRRRFARA
ncbi:MAG: VPLPA-CTERM sorting domain-containing protein [Candidatus Acidiferrales bacterium]